MYLVVGLGNPGDEYEHTRHNAGFDAIDILGKTLGANYWKNEVGAQTAHVKARVSEFERAAEPGGQVKRIAGPEPQEIILAKPQSFMNESGGPIKALCQLYKIQPDHVIVIHDDMDLPTDSLRVKFGGGHAGHNGLKSIIAKLGTQDYFRIRVGVGKPEHPNVIDYVLGRPKGKALDDFNEGCQRAAEAAECLLAQGIDTTQQTFN